MRGWGRGKVTYYRNVKCVCVYWGEGDRPCEADGVLLLHWYSRRVKLSTARLYYFIIFLGTIYFQVSFNYSLIHYDSKMTELINKSEFVC